MPQIIMANQKSDVKKTHFHTQNSQILAVNPPSSDKLTYHIKLLSSIHLYTSHIYIITYFYIHISMMTPKKMPWISPPFFFQHPFWPQRTPGAPGASFLQVLPAVRPQRGACHVAALQGRQGADALGEVHGGQGSQGTGELLWDGPKYVHKI